MSGVYCVGVPVCHNLPSSSSHLPLPLCISSCCHSISPQDSETLIRCLLCMLWCLTKDFLSLVIYFLLQLQNQDFNQSQYWWVWPWRILTHVVSLLCRLILLSSVTVNRPNVKCQKYSGGKSWSVDWREDQQHHWCDLHNLSIKGGRFRHLMGKIQNELKYLHFQALHIWCTSHQVKLVSWFLQHLSVMTELTGVARTHYA